MNFSTYQVPDVYVQEAASPLVSIVGLGPAVVAIVGPTMGYKTQTDPVLLTGTTPVVLSQSGIDTTSIVVQDASGTTHLATDYGVVATIPAAIDLPHQTFTIARSSGSTLVDGVVAYVTYHYTDPSYFTPQTFSNFEDVKTAFGEPLDLATNDIESPVSLAAQVVFSNGAGQIVIVPTTDVNLTATRAGLAAAYTRLAAMEVDIVLPLPVGLTGAPLSVGDIINVGVDLKTHCESLSALGQFRVGIIGYESSVTVAPDAIAQGIGSSRVVPAWPNQMSYFNGPLNQTFVVSGYYLAAAYAGRLAGNTVQQPLTQKKVSGFSGIPATTLQTMTVAYKNQLSAAGVAVAEPKSGAASNLVCRHGVTSLGTSVMTREISLVRCADAMISLIRATFLGSGLIGSPTTPNTLTVVKGVTQGVLDTLVAQGIIVAYSGLTVQQQSVNPTVMAVRYAYSPSYPLNYISVTFSIDTITGGVAPITQGQ